MSKIAVIYWSGTGNTEAMADLVANAATAAGAAVDLSLIHICIGRGLTSPFFVSR